MQTAENIRGLKQLVPPHIRIVAVSKTMPEASIMEAYQSGHKIFGENRVNELLRKQASLPPDIEWHFIGHLQSNKVKFIAPFINTIQSVDTLNLLSVINNEALKNKRIINCLLQLRIAKEETKYGLTFESITEILVSPFFVEMKNISISGIMGMATFTHDIAQIRSEFHYLATCFWKIKTKYFSQQEKFCELSMGMSGDYRIAIEEGSTMLRIGSLIFGART
jgi:pyridoxal phosphate enzyme (YggS family)